MLSPVLALALVIGDSPSIATVDALWPRRDEPEAAATLRAAARSYGEASDYDHLWRAARWDVWMAAGELPKGEVRRYAQAGRDAAERALRANPEGIEAKYWGALSLGLFASTSDVFQAMGMGLDQNYRDPLQAVAAAAPGSDNPNVEWVGPLVAIAAYEQALPWPKQDRDQARRLFERALHSHPENLRAHYLWADFLRSEDPQAARRELETVINGSEAYDPPDARRYKAKAAELLPKVR